MAVANHVWASFIDLDEICTFFELLADHSYQFSGIVCVGRVRQHVLRRVEVIGIFVSTENVDGVPADAQARSRDQALIDGVAYGGIG